MAIYYLKEDNVFMDGEGEIVFEIFDIITPNDLYLFKQNKENMLVKHCVEPNMYVELYWPEDDECDLATENRLCYDYTMMTEEERVEYYEKAGLFGYII